MIPMTSDIGIIAGRFTEYIFVTIMFFHAMVFLLLVSPRNCPPLIGFAAWPLEAIIGRSGFVMNSKPYLESYERPS
jgi:hypothetical protein